MRYAFESFTPLLRGKSVDWQTDNQAVPAVVQTGSRNPDLQGLAVKLFHASTSIGVDLAITWVPRDENNFADHISKHVDYDDWKTSAECFRILDNIWGPHTVDRFSTPNTGARVAKQWTLFPRTGMATQTGWFRQCI